MSLDYFTRALLEAVLAGALAGLVGVLVVLRGRAFFTMSLTHATFPGAVLAAILGVSIPLGAAATAVALVLIATLIGRIPTQGSAVASGIMLTAGFAVGSFAETAAHVPIDVGSFLTGTILATTTADLGLTAAVLVVAIVVIAVYGRHLLFASFDETGFRAAGLKPARAEAVSLALIAATVVAIMPALGAILAVGLIVAPAAAARRLVRSATTMLWVAPIIGIACAVAGLLVSRAWSVSAGGAITLIAAAVVGLAHLVPQRRTVPAPAAAGSVVAS